MKKPFLLYGLILIAAQALHAQEEPEPAQLNSKAAQKIQDLNIAYLSEKLNLTPAQAEKFWPIYREYAQQRKALQRELRAALRDAKTGNSSPQQQQALLDLRYKVKQQELNLEKEYNGRLLKIMNAEQVLTLPKAEQEFRALIINQLQQRRLMQQRKEDFRDQNQRLRQKPN
jgi:hypothetical protein